jgi:Zn-finger nucleic acid-binding protein
MTSPYRESPRMLLCPRCAEVLEPLGDGVSACLACAGVWLSTAAVADAFGRRQGPPGQALWWRNAVLCPVCTQAGTETLMTARQVDGTMIDLCEQHGMWLDDHELHALAGAKVQALAVRIDGSLEALRRGDAAPVRRAADADAAELARLDGQRRTLRARIAELERELASVEGEIAVRRSRTTPS